MKKSTAYQIDPGQVVSYMQQTENEAEEGNIYGLIVLGEEEVSTVVNTVRGSSHRRQIRVIPVKSLLTLLELKYNASLQSEQIVKLLLPLDTINVGEIVQLIDDIVETRVREDQIVSPEEEEEEVERTIPRTTREELEELEDGRVVVCPSKPDGVNFLKKHSAWGFVNIATQPEYFALYVSAPESSIQYFAKVKDIIKPEDPASPVADTYEKFRSYEPGRQLILLEEDSLHQLEEEIPLGDNRRMAPQNLRYFRLSDLREAKTLDDLA